MTCELCQQWVARSWSQYDLRHKNMREHPRAEVFACPKCNSTDWATLPPPTGPRGSERSTWQRWRDRLWGNKLVRLVGFLALITLAYWAIIIIIIWIVSG